MLAISWTFVGETDQAARIFQEVFDRRLAADNFPAASEVANELGRVLLEAGDLDGAEAWYRRGFEIANREGSRPDWQVRLAELRWAHAQARIAARRGQPDEAHAQEARVAALLEQGGNDDQRVQHAYLRGYVAYHLKDYGAATTFLQEADHEDPFILLLLAQSAEAQGDASAARTYYERVLASTSHAVTNAFARPIAREKVGAR
jgi:tetratricopeptide (TPR) repeat protein